MTMLNSIKSKTLMVKRTSTRHSDEVGDLIEIGNETYYIVGRCVENFVSYDILYPIKIWRLTAFTHIRLFFIAFRYLLGI